MPTVLDQLVVELSLDPSKFTIGAEQAKKAQRSLLSDLGSLARGLQENLLKAAGAKLDLIRGLEKEYAALMAVGDVEGAVNTKQLMEAIKATGIAVAGLGEVGQRAGTAVARSGQVGAAGIRQIAVAGLAAYESLKALHALFHGFVDATQETAQLGRVAGMAGVSPQWLGTFEMWMQTFGAAPERVGQSVLGIQQSIQKLLTTGDWDENIKALLSLPTRAAGQFGNLSASTAEQLNKQMNEAVFAGNIPKVIQTIVESVRGLKPETATSLLTQIGIDPSMIPGFLAGLDRMREGMQYLHQYAPTPDQIQRYQELWGQINITEQAFSSLGRALLSAPVTNMFDNVLKGLELWAAEAAQTPAELEALRAGFAAVAAVVSITLVSAIARLIFVMNTWWALPATRALMGFALLAGGVPAAIVAGLITALKPTAAGSEAETDAERKLWEEARRRAGVGQLPPGAKPTDRYPGGYPDTDSFESLWRKLNETPGAPGVFPEPRNNPGNIRDPSGSGFMQYPSMAAGETAMDQLLLSYQDKYGLNTLAGIIGRWSPPGENPTAQLIAVASVRTGFAPFQPLNLHDPSVLARIHAAIEEQEYPKRVGSSGAYNYGSAGQRAVTNGGNSSGNPLVNTTHNYGDASTSIGQVTVNAPTGNGQDIANALNRAIRNNSMVNTANQGMQ